MTVDRGMVVAGDNICDGAFYNEDYLNLVLGCTMDFFLETLETPGHSAEEVSDGLTLEADRHFSAVFPLAPVVTNRSSFLDNIEGGQVSIEG